MLPHWTLSQTILKHRSNHKFCCFLVLFANLLIHLGSWWHFKQTCLSPVIYSFNSSRLPRLHDNGCNLMVFAMPTWVVVLGLFLFLQAAPYCGWWWWGLHRFAIVAEISSALGDVPDFLWLLKSQMCVILLVINSIFLGATNTEKAQNVTWYFLFLRCSKIRTKIFLH